MNQNNFKEVYKSWGIDINDICFIAFFTSRLFTALFTLVFGMRGVVISMAALCLLYLVALIYNIKHKKYHFLTAFTIFFGILALTFATAYFNPATRFWLGDYEWGFLVRVLDVRKALFAVWVVLLVFNKKKLLRDFNISAWIFSFYVILQVILYFVNGNWNAYFNWSSSVGVEPLYNMNLGYEIIFSAVVILLDGYKRSNKAEFAYGIFLTSLAFLVGSRGLFIITICFVFFLFFFKARGKEQKKKAFVYICVMLVSCFALMNVENMGASYLASTSTHEEIVQEEDVEKPATESRNAEMLSSGGLTTSNGRFQIWDLSANGAKQYLSEGHIFGGGVYGDRPFVGHEFEWGYSHNIFLEMITSFGILGLALIIYLAYMAFKIMLDKDEPEYSDLIFISLTLSTKLLISDSFWFLSYFWVFLTVIYLYTTRKKEYHVSGALRNIVISAVACAVSFGFFFSDDFKQQDFKAISFDEPTCCIVVSNALNPMQYEKAELLSQEGVPYTACLRFNNFETDSTNAQSRFNNYKTQDNVDIEDGAVEDIMYWGLTYADMVSNVDVANSFLAASGIENPVVLCPPYGKTAKQTAYNLDGLRKFVLIDDTSHDAVIKNLNKSTALNLPSIVINDSMSKKKFDNVKELINDAYDSNAFITVVFETNVGADQDDKVNLQYVQEILDLLESKGFKFTNFRDVSAETNMSPEDLTVGNYLKNSTISQYIK